MILSEVRTTIRDKLFNLGYQEWEGFLDDNIPLTILENTFHVGVNGGSGNALNMQQLKISNDVVITLWRKGYNNSVEAQDAGLASVQELLCDLLSPAFRTASVNSKIDLSSYELSTISADNESICKVIINLNVELYLEVTQTVN
jgi:hypothetical protein